MVGKNYNILIVEDEFITAKFIKDVLITLNHETITIVSTANEAIEIVKEGEIDLVFMDININGAIDGIQCATIINQTRPIPIIYITAYGDSETIKEAGETNLYGYLIKPFDENDLEATLNVALTIISHVNKASSHQIASTTIELANNYLYNFKTRTLTIDNAVVEFTKKEMLIFHLFCLNLNQNISYDSLLEYVWDSKTVTHSTIRDTISRVRKKTPLLNIENIVGLGYCLKKG
ncbi:MAG: response regulator [Campylobacterota bacterium]|nr:response regulator [Campylobacterota bacterium]